MKTTAEEILREEVLKVTKGKDFTHNVTHDGIITAMKRYAQLVSQQALENAAENVKLVLSDYGTNDKGINGWIETELKYNLFIINDGANIVASKSSITNPDNIPITI